MFIFKKKFSQLENRIADLEVQVQSHHEVPIKHIGGHQEENALLRKIFEEFQNSIK